VNKQDRAKAHMRTNVAKMVTCVRTLLRGEPLSKWCADELLEFMANAETLVLDESLATTSAHLGHALTAIIGDHGVAISNGDIDPLWGRWLEEQLKARGFDASYSDRGLRVRLDFGIVRIVFTQTDGLIALIPEQAQL